MTDPVTTITSFGDVGAGAILDDKYRVLSVLGRGGMGVVVEAVHTRLGEHVAIKFLAADQHNNKEARERFDREARATVRMRSPHVTRVRDVGELPTGQPYIVMELLVGVDLAKLLATETLASETIVDLMLQACEALAEAHAMGIVHRDIKPANLFVTRTIDGAAHLKLLDFGVATGARGDLQLTNTGFVVGTPAYMCPEQMRSGRDARPPWDLWALGVVMFEAFEHAHPFFGESYAELAVSVLTAEPRPMALTPESLRPIIARCLSKSPEQRFGDAAELAEALAPFGSTTQAASSRGRTARVLGRAASAPIVSVPSHVPIRGPWDSTMTPNPSPIPDRSPSFALHPTTTPAPPSSEPTAMLPAAPLSSASVAASGITAAPSIITEAPPSIVQPAPRRRLAIALGATAALVAIVGTLLFVTSRAPESAAPPDAAPRAGLPSIAPDAATSAPPSTAPDAATVTDPIDASISLVADSAPAPVDAAAPPRRDASPSKPRRDAGATPATAIDAGAPPDDALTETQLMQGRH